MPPRRRKSFRPAVYGGGKMRGRRREAPPSLKYERKPSRREMTEASPGRRPTAKREGSPHRNCRKEFPLYDGKRGGEQISALIEFSPADIHPGDDMPLETPGTQSISDHELSKIHNALQDLISEVEILRVRVDHLSPKAEAYDALIKVLGLVPAGDRAMHRDVVYQARGTLAVVEKMIWANQPDAAKPPKDVLDVKG